MMPKALPRRLTPMPTGKRNGKAPRILIADDATDSREMYEEYLSFEGFEVDTAADGRQALAKAVAARPDVLVLDLTMPGMDGWDVATSLKGDPRTRDVRIIAVTGHALTGSEAAARKAGVDAFLSKPCLPEDLAAEIKVQLRRTPRPT